MKVNELIQKLQELEHQDYYIELEVINQEGYSVSGYIQKIKEYANHPKIYFVSTD